MVSTELKGNTKCLKLKKFQISFFNESNRIFRKLPFSTHLNVKKQALTLFYSAHEDFLNLKCSCIYTLPPLAPNDIGTQRAQTTQERRWHAFQTESITRHPFSGTRPVCILYMSLQVTHRSFWRIISSLRHIEYDSCACKSIIWSKIL